MEKIVEIEFSKLRHAYVVVKQFLEKEALEKLTSTGNKVSADLGLDGDDNYDMLIKFVEKFELDYSEFDYSEYFYSEGELFGSSAALWNLLSISIWLPIKTIELLSFNKLKIEKPGFHIPNREVKDLTFREMIDWYIHGEFQKDSIKYKIATTHNSG